MRTFATLFSRLEPVAFEKGVGRIAFHFARDLGWNSILAACELKSSPPPEWYTDHVTVHQLGSVTLSQRSTQFTLMAEFLYANAHSIDVLNLYDLRMETYLLSRLYKTLNPKGVVFIKADMDQRAVDMLHTGGTRIGLHRAAIRRSGLDFITVETKTIWSQINDFFATLNLPTYLVPIGFDPPQGELRDDWEQKQKLIISVGRTGSQQKHNELLLEALLQIPEKEMEGWRVLWIGDDELGFRKRASSRLVSAPGLQGAVDFIDHIWNRDDLYGIYKEASIFALSSRWESFATVLAEVPYFGAYPVSTDVGAARDITQDGRLGRIVPVEDTVLFANALRYAMNLSEEERKMVAEETRSHINEHFTWKAIAKMIESLTIGT